MAAAWSETVGAYAPRSRRSTEPGTGGLPCWSPPALGAAAESGASSSIDIDIDAVAVDIPDMGIRSTIMTDAARLLDRRA